MSGLTRHTCGKVWHAGPQLYHPGPRPHEPLSVAPIGSRTFSRGSTFPRERQAKTARPHPAAPVRPRQVCGCSTAVRARLAHPCDCDPACRSGAGAQRGTGSGTEQDRRTPNATVAMPQADRGRGRGVRGRWRRLFARHSAAPPSTVLVAFLRRRTWVIHARASPCGVDARCLLIVGLVSREEPV
jgi:hypothetical protein